MIAKEGWPFVIPFLVCAFLFYALDVLALFVLFVLIALSFCFFFRDPKRKTPEGEGLICSPADGKIVKIQSVDSSPLFQGSATVVGIFLSLFEVHITRAPYSGVVKDVDFKTGKFFPAYKDRASRENASNSIFISGDTISLLVRQIVGVAARRIKCFVKKDEKITRGQKIGLMYFGSRVEVFLPLEVKLRISLNQKVKAGLSIIGEIQE